MAVATAPEGRNSGHEDNIVVTTPTAFLATGDDRRTIQLDNFSEAHSPARKLVLVSSGDIRALAIGEGQDPLVAKAPVQSIFVVDVH